jgi:hypothetical protein
VVEPDTRDDAAVPDDLLSLWARVDAHLRAALAAVDIGESDRSEVEDLLDHNELGSAFEWIVAALVEAGGVVSSDARKHLAAAASDMGLSGDPDWRRLDASSG